MLGLLSLLLFGPVASQAPQVPRLGIPVTHNPSVVGDLRLFPNFKSKILGNSRTIRVWLPPGYFHHPNAHYPVLYMEDGQNLFDKALSPFSHAEWRCDETATGLINAKVIPPLIIVGIDNVDRENEYLPTYDAEEKFGGKGAAYGKFVVNELKPFIDRTFRTKTDRADTATGGSSLGAVISLYFAMTYPNVFSKFMLVSTAPWTDHHEVLTALQSYKPSLSHDRIWEDIGTAEGGDQVPDSNRLARLLQAHGLVMGKTLAYFVDAGAIHSETAWQQRFGMALMFLYRK